MGTGRTLALITLGARFRSLRAATTTRNHLEHGDTAATVRPQRLPRRRPQSESRRRKATSEPATELDGRSRPGAGGRVSATEEASEPGQRAGRGDPGHRHVHGCCTKGSGEGLKIGYISLGDSMPFVKIVSDYIKSEATKAGVEIVVLRLAARRREGPRLRAQPQDPGRPGRHELPARLEGAPRRSARPGRTCRRWRSTSTRRRARSPSWAPPTATPAELLGRGHGQRHARLAHCTYDTFVLLTHRCGRRHQGCAATARRPASRRPAADPDDKFREVDGKATTDARPHGVRRHADRA